MSLARYFGGLLAFYSIFILSYPYLIPYLAWLPLGIRYCFDQIHLIRGIHLMLCIGALAFLAYGKRTSLLGDALLSAMSLPCAAILSVTVKDPLISLMILILWFATFPLDAILGALKRQIKWKFVILLLYIPATLYLIVDYEKIIYRVVFPTDLDVLVGWTMILLLLYATNVKISWPLPAIVLVFLNYTLFGSNLPPPIGHTFRDIPLAIGKAWMETEAGIFGLPLGVSAKYIVYFTILAGVLQAIGITKFISDFASAFLGRAPQDVGRATTVYSAVMGMVSGSGVAVTTTVATTMLSSFRRAGYDEKFSSAFIAGTGTAALITPPILGAAAFIMMEVMGIDYKTLIIMTILPALLYYFSLQVYLELYTRKHGLKATGDVERRSKKDVLKQLYMLLPIAVLIYMIFQGYTIAMSVVTATFIACLIGIARRVKPLEILKGFSSGALDVIPVALACACAGLILHSLLVTGLGMKIEEIVRFLSAGNYYICLILLAIFTLILGMGVPPTASYVIVSALVIPATIKLAVDHGFPEIVAHYSVHVFAFYYAILADVTPPVALAAYAAAAVAGQNPLRIAIIAAKIAIIKYLLAFSFVLAPAGSALLIVLHLDNPLEIVARAVLVALSAIAINSATVGYFRGNLNLASRAILLVAGVLLIIPLQITNVMGLILTLAVFAFKLR
uniref:TRAP transporter fused permease subunit n=1 Tax=Archaeoglobus fulgidus TaxID=2234 RepID=A0A7J2TM56_ARCFL